MKRLKCATALNMTVCPVQGGALSVCVRECGQLISLEVLKLILYSLQGGAKSVSCGECGQCKMCYGSKQGMRFRWPPGAAQRYGSGRFCVGAIALTRICYFYKRQELFCRIVRVGYASM